MIYLTKDELIEIHDHLIKQFGGSSGILAPEKIELCIKAPRRIIFGTVVYETVFMKAAALIYEICKLHPFVDGNKRTGYGAADVFLRLNGYILRADKDEAVQKTIAIARCTMDRDATAEWIIAHVQK